MDKRAVSPETLVILLAFVIGALILIAFGSALGSQLKEDADIETCRLTALAQSQTRKIPVVGVSTPKTIISLDCPRRNVKIFENKVELNGKKYGKYSFKKLSADEANRFVAEELRLCWYKMLEGKEDIFESSYIANLNKVCLICSEIEFDSGLNGKTFDGLLEYIKSKKIPRRDTTYYNYLVRQQSNKYLLNAIPWTQYTPWGYGTTQKFSDDKLSANQKYTIYFLAWKPDWLNQFIGAYTASYYIGLGDENKLSAECDLSVN